MKQEDTEKIIDLLEEIKQELKNLSEKINANNFVIPYPFSQGNIPFVDSDEYYDEYRIASSNKKV